MRSKYIYILFFFISFLFFSCFSKKEKKIITWNFPLPRTHTGVLMGNGIQGLMVWGQDNQLNITVSRAGFWDHRGGKSFIAGTTFQDIKKLLYANDEKSIQQIFSTTPSKLNYPERSYQLGGGRLEFIFPEGFKLMNAELNIMDASLKICIQNKKNKIEHINIYQSVYDELAFVDLPKKIANQIQIKLIPTYEFPAVKERLEKIGVAAPLIWTEEEKEIIGFTQTLPEDKPLSLAYQKNKNKIKIATSLDQQSKEKVQEILKKDWSNVKRETKKWWGKYWNDVPSINIPDKDIQEIYEYGLYKQACSTPSHGIACALQGSFMEEYMLPAWSNDYHFNINIEMIYWPALTTNRLDHFDPLWKMLMSWLPEMQKNGMFFYGKEGAILMPHAVDDRCKIIGNFWTGSIDQACAAWMAQLAWLHYRYSMDEKILKDIAFPLMNGAFEGYYAMMEEILDSNGIKRLSLPITVSPEYKGKRMDAWGRDASFQLAACHRVTRDLIKAATVLNKPIDPRWLDVEKRLPLFTLVTESKSLEYPEAKATRIALWEGMDLPESHRHHSFISSIYPFAIINPFDTNYKKIIENTLDHWVILGSGKWSGWCVPWASIINARTGRIDAAVQWLHYWKQNFTNIGRGTLHDADFKGTSSISSYWYTNPNHKEIMQLDAGFGAIDAVHNLFIHQQDDDILNVLSFTPRDWYDYEFNNIRTEGAFLLSAKVKNKKVSEITIKSLVGGEIKIKHHLGEKYFINDVMASDSVFSGILKKDQELFLKRVQ